MLNHMGSSEQEAAIRHGIGDKNFSWKPLDLGEPLPVPEIITGASIDWVYHFDNSPRFQIALSAEPKDDFRFVEERPGLYVARTPEGFAKWHFHSGKPEQQDGYGGRHFHLTMADGSEKVLKGPWHTSPPSDVLEVHYTLPNWSIGFFGLGITFALLEGIRQKFMPRIIFARVSEYGGSTIQPISPIYNKPKCLLRKSGEELKAEAEKVGWDKVHRYPEME